ncbi:unnamed protein product [Haemonchus placei]|uniref:Uncharacterized protein n=1 Tax=Haemonchus placei TaxID=6290 RepID=A0A0N4VZ45_HAEPC|nr:unnamed protein product [Haemonchus placei]
MLDQTDNASSPSNADIMAALEHVVGRLHSLEAAVNELLKRSEPRSSCIFCPVADNRDGHNTTRCNRFPEAVAKLVFVVVASNLHMKTTTVECSAQHLEDHPMCYCAPTEDKAAVSNDDHEDDGQRADTLKKEK